MQTVTTIRDTRLAILPWRKNGETVALVPTMGALHRGHLALVQQAKKIAKRVLVTIFVNPMQFGANEDLGRYPRQLEADQKLLTEAGCDALFCPSVEEMYPHGFAASIDPGPLATVFEGALRPGHFQGVATVVVKLLMQGMPDAALFGEKDYQQLQILRHVTHDLDIPTHIIPVPIVRDADGLALSSRNIYLSPDERQRALALPRGLLEAESFIRTGGDITIALKLAYDQMTAAGFKVDYFELVDAATLQPVRTLEHPARLLAAGKIGTTRLIDNLAVRPRA